MKTKTYFTFRVDVWDSAANSIMEHIAGIDDFEVSLFVPAFHHHPRALAQRDLLTRLRRQRHSAPSAALLWVKLVIFALLESVEAYKFAIFAIECEV